MVKNFVISVNFQLFVKRQIFSNNLKDCSKYNFFQCMNFLKVFMNYIVLAYMYIYTARKQINTPDYSSLLYLYRQKLLNANFSNFNFKDRKILKKIIRSVPYNYICVISCILSRAFPNFVEDQQQIFVFFFFYCFLSPITILYIDNALCKINVHNVTSTMSFFSSIYI